VAGSGDGGPSIVTAGHSVSNGSETRLEDHLFRLAFVEMDRCPRIAVDERLPEGSDLGARAR